MSRLYPLIWTVENLDLEKNYSVFICICSGAKWKKETQHWRDAVTDSCFLASVHTNSRIEFWEMQWLREGHSLTLQGYRNWKGQDENIVWQNICSWGQLASVCLCAWWKESWCLQTFPSGPCSSGGQNQGSKYKWQWSDYDLIPYHPVMKDKLVVCVK